MSVKLETPGGDIRINLSFAASVTLMLILDESGMCALALFCCIIHETGHLICLRTMGEVPSGIVLSFYGIRLERMPSAFHGRKKEMLVFASGPFANIFSSVIFMLLSAANGSLVRWAAVSLLVGCFNLLPCRPLDGGNMLFTRLSGTVGEERSEKICGFVSAAIIIPAGAAGIFFAVRYGNFTLAATCAYLAAANLTVKKENKFL